MTDHAPKPAVAAMKAISLWQPWASLWLIEGAKLHETRSWPTRHRGPLAVHASKRIVGPEDFLFGEVEEIDKALGISDVPGAWEQMPRGGIIGIVEIVDCQSTAIVTPAPLDLMFGNFEAGRYAWRRAPNPVRLAEPVYCRGFQGIWNLPPNITEKLHD